MGTSMILLSGVHRDATFICAARVAMMAEVSCGLNAVHTPQTINATAASEKMNNQIPLSLLLSATVCTHPNSLFISIYVVRFIPWFFAFFHEKIGFSRITVDFKRKL